MEFTVRAATTAELPELMQLYTNARAFMQTHGNPTQWHAGYPGEARLAAEIERGVCHVVMGEETIQAVFCLIPGDDPTYHHIEDGAWPEDVPYATIHRLASAGHVGGIGRLCVQWCLQQGLPVRADTHARQHLYAAHAESLRLCALRDNLHRGRHAKVGVLPLRNINNSAPHSRYRECGALLC